MITEQQILEILNLRESNIDGGETLGIHCIEYGNIAKAVLKLLEPTPLSDQGDVWTKQQVIDAWNSAYVGDSFSSGKHYADYIEQSSALKTEEQGNK